MYREKAVELSEKAAEIAPRVASPHRVVAIATRRIIEDTDLNLKSLPNFKIEAMVECEAAAIESVLLAAIERGIANGADPAQLETMMLRLTNSLIGGGAS